MKLVKLTGLLLCGVVALLSPHPLVAAEATTPPTSFAGFYLGVGAGVAAQKILEENVSTTDGVFSFDQPDAKGSGVSGQVLAGYGIDVLYRFNISATLFYNFGPNNIETIKAAFFKDAVEQSISNEFGLYISPGFYLRDGTLLYAKAGLSVADIGYTRDNFDLSLDKTVFGGLYGAGLKQMITDAVYVGVDYTRTTYDRSTIGSDQTLGVYEVDIKARARDDSVLFSVGYVF